MHKNELTTAFTEDEKALIDRLAAEWGLSFEEAAAQLASDGLAKRVQRKTQRRPATSVRRFHQH